MRVGRSLQAVDRHDREQLIDGPAVGQRLEHREVAEVDVGEDRLELFELFGHFVELAGEVAHLGAGRPVEPLGQAALLERQQPEIEHLQHLIARGLRIVIALDHAPFGDRAVGVEQVAHRLRQFALAAFLVFLARDPELVERRAAERIEDEHAVVRGDRAPGLADDHRMRDLARVADVGDAIHHVVGVFVERVVHRRGEVRAAAVVVDAEAAADVDVLAGRRPAT